MSFFQSTSLLVLLLSATTEAFAPSSFGRAKIGGPLYVSIGLGPGEEKGSEDSSVMTAEKQEEYEIPNHEEYRLARRSKLDQECDEWFRQLLEAGGEGALGQVAQDSRSVLTTPVELKNDVEKHHDDEECTPYVATSLPWTPLYPAFGLEEFGLPIPRRNAETWRHFDVPGLIAQDYSLPSTAESQWDLKNVKEQLQIVGGWLDDEMCAARLIYVNGRFVPELSKTDENLAYNLASESECDEETKSYLRRLTDGFTDDLVSLVPNGDGFETSYQKLSRPDHNIGEPTSQFAINTQQGTACFAALNTIKTPAVALVKCPAGKDKDVELPKPVLIVEAVTPCGGANSDQSLDKGVSVHPRAVIIAEDDARLSVVQSCVDLAVGSSARPKLYNGYTQIFVGARANVTHSYLEETGGIVTGGVEQPDEAFGENDTIPRQAESKRPGMSDSHLEAIDVHIAGEDGAYQGTLMSVGGSGHVRIAQSVTLLQPGAHATVNGFSLAGGAQRTDVKTNIHHIAAGTTSHQTQKNMIGGRATGSFRGRIRVEQSAQQTDSSQLSRSILLSDKARAWAVPSLEIIADDVQCTHGATVSDLSEEELFYLRSRGVDRTMSRNLLMYAFAGDISSNVDPAMLGALGSNDGLQKRVIRRLENVVPQGDRAVRGEFQSV